MKCPVLSAVITKRFSSKLYNATRWINLNQYYCFNCRANTTYTILRVHNVATIMLKLYKWNYGNLVSVSSIVWFIIPFYLHYYFPRCFILLGTRGIVLSVPCIINLKKLEILRFFFIIENYTYRSYKRNFRQKKNKNTNI